MLVSVIRIPDNAGSGISEGSAAAGPTSDNVALANVLSAREQGFGFAMDVGGGER